MNIRIMSLLILPVLLLLSAKAYAQNDNFDIALIKNQIAAFEKVLSEEHSRQRYSELKKELSLTIESLKACEKRTVVELDEISSAHSVSGVNKGEQATSDELRDPAFRLLESTLQRRLIECKYWLLKTSQLRERTLSVLSTDQMSDYFKATQLFWNSEFQHQEITWSSKIQLAFIFALVYLILQVSMNYLIVQKKQWFGDIRNFVATATTLVIGCVALAYAKQEQIISDVGYWLVLASFMITSASIICTRFISILYIAIGVLTSTLLLEPTIWQISKYFHLLIISVTIGVLFLMEQIKTPFGSNFVHRAMLVIIALTELADYHTLSHQLITIVFLLHILTHLHFVVIESISSVIGYIYSSKNHVLAKLRRVLKVSKKQSIPGLDWIRWTLYTSVMVLGILSLLGYSGVSEALVETLQVAFSEGFYIGTININLQNILIALLVFGLLVTIASFVRRKIELIEGVENSAQTAKAALFWYAAMATSILTALSISGFNVQNLALIAGAFSVGIGFGLQNIVSNFVSGIILLIERPVKPGDWVIIGNTEGIVREINIRATQIRTFDKSDILVPNTEFISNQVTNLTLGDNVGRLRFTVGVAYGSDTDKVHEILKDIVAQHPGIINDDAQFAPTIVFRQFGESSLDFEIRCFLKDIGNIILIRSDIHFEIDKQFRLANITIPFPQRDLHIKNTENQSLGNLNSSNGGSDE